MPNQQQQEQKSGKKQQAQPAFPTLPKSIEKRVSMKWLTLHALENVVHRLQAQGGEANVILLTAWGQVEGRLCDIQPSYAESFRQEQDHLLPDVASMVTHVRSEMLMTFEQEEKQLEIIDAAPILSLCDVKLNNGSGEYRLPQLTLFADQVIGFTLASIPHLH